MYLTIVMNLIFEFVLNILLYLFGKCYYTNILVFVCAS